jgi:hypothetical protein
VNLMTSEWLVGCSSSSLFRTEIGVMSESPVIHQEASFHVHDCIGDLPSIETRPDYSWIADNSRRTVEKLAPVDSLSEKSW